MIFFLLNATVGLDLKILDNFMPFSSYLAWMQHNRSNIFKVQLVDKMF